MEVGDRLRRLREAHGIESKELAKIAGRSPQLVSGWESGVSAIRTPELYRICEHFQVTADWLLFGRTSTLAVQQKQWLVEHGVIEA